MSTSWRMQPVCTTRYVGERFQLSSHFQWVLRTHSTLQSGDVFLVELEATKKAIETAQSICSRANDSHAELQVEIPTLFECIK